MKLMERDEIRTRKSFIVNVNLFWDFGKYSNGSIVSLGTKNTEYMIKRGAS